MGILINKDSQVLVQGITGKEGQRAASAMRAYGTSVVAGVTPGKGGMTVADAPVYNSVKEAVSRHTITASFIAVPPTHVKSASCEAIEQKIPLLVILTEHVPVQDCAWIYAKASQQGVRVIGPSSIGIISPGEARIGSIGGDQVNSIFKSGPVGVVSKSGGMTSEISLALTRSGFGQSTAVGIGGDQLICSDFVDIVMLFEEDPKTKVVVVFGEVGGTYEEQLADSMQNGKIKKPLVALVAGAFTEGLPEETALGHAGTIVQRGRGSYKSKVDTLTKAGAHIAYTLDDIVIHVRNLCI